MSKDAAEGSSKCFDERSRAGGGMWSVDGPITGTYLPSVPERGCSGDLNWVLRRQNAQVPPRGARGLDARASW